MADYDDNRHRREQAELREKRKASKSQKSDAQREKERKRKEHAQKILGKQQGQHGAKKQKIEPTVKTSKFQDLFAQRAQGFQIDFKFRNAPPRPPVGPCFVGNGLEGVLQEISQYKPLNAVEVNYSWKLHSEPDLGVPLAPSAMDPRSYSASTKEPTLHPDDKDLLEWKGSLGDTAAEDLKKRRDYARAAARLAMMGKSPAKLLEKAKSPVASASKRKDFSRVLDEKMQSWMKKTTYLSNDYSRKVHDFKSLAKTKDEIEKDLQVRQQEMSQRRSASAISKTFDECKQSVTKHPSKKNITPVTEMPFLPNVEYWGNPYTHVVIDKSPGDTDRIGKAFVANVQKKDVNSRMTCQLFIPSKDETEEAKYQYQAIQQYDLDVLPLKEEDVPHVNFCIWVDPATEVATYLPISSRVQLSTGRPLKKKNYNMNITRRPMNDNDKREIDERLAEVDVDIEERLQKEENMNDSNMGLQNGNSDSVDKNKKTMQVDESADDGDIGSDEDGFPGNATKTIMAEG